MSFRTIPIALFAAASVAAWSACADESAEPQITEPTVAVDAPAGVLVSAEVADVIDAVTIRVLIDGESRVVRYLGLEVPDGDAAAVEEAFAFNRFLVDDKSVEIERGEVDSDDAGRSLRYVYVNGQMVNLSLLINGHAQVSEFPAGFAHRDRFVLAQENARAGLRGVWKVTSDTSLAAETPPTPSKFGTLPALPSDQSAAFACEYSGNSEPAIKANVDQRTGEMLYHVPGSLFYSTVEINEDDGDRWFCTEYEAMAAGWKKSKR